LGKVADRRKGFLMKGTEVTKTEKKMKTEIIWTKKATKHITEIGP
jgi:hypothetical protein